MPARKHDGFPEVVRGTVLVHRRKCGKPNCRCASGEEFHETTVLSYKEGGKTKHLMLAPVNVDPVRAATERFRTARVRLEAEGNAGLAQLIARLKSHKTS